MTATTCYHGHPWTVTDLACAIVESVERTAIVHLDWTPEVEEELFGNADLEGTADRGSVLEVWGKTDGEGWRIHLHWYWRGAK